MPIGRWAQAGSERRLLATSNRRRQIQSEMCWPRSWNSCWSRRNDTPTAAASCGGSRVWSWRFASTWALARWTTREPWTGSGISRAMRSARLATTRSTLPQPCARRLPAASDPPDPTCASRTSGPGSLQVGGLRRQAGEEPAGPSTSSIRARGIAMASTSLYPSCSIVHGVFVSRIAKSPVPSVLDRSFCSAFTVPFSTILMKRWSVFMIFVS